MIVTSEQARRAWCFGDLMTILATGEETGGTYALWIEEVWPSGGTPPHIHHAEQEVFYVLEGEMTFYYEGKPTTAKPGTLVHIPKDTMHFYQNRSAHNVKMLCMVNPAGFEQMLLALSEPVVEGQPRPGVTPEVIARLTELAAQYHMSMPQVEPT